MSLKNIFSGFGLFSNDLAIDLGTANTLIWMRSKGVVLNEPTIVAYDAHTKRIIAIGNDAQSMVGKTHKDIEIVRPLRDGVIADFEITEGMLRAFIRKISNTFQPAKRVVVAVPSGITEVEKRTVRDSCEHAGAKEVHLIAEPMAAAIGIGLNVHEPVGNMIIDIGGGTSEIAVIALSGIVTSESIKHAGDEMTQAVLHYFKRVHNLMIGDRTAEMIKCSVGSATPMKNEVDVEVRGRDLLSGIPKMITVSSVDIRGALSDSVDKIVQGVLRSLEKTPAEISADIFDRGIILSGGGALLKGLDERIRKETNLPVHTAEDPLTAVVRGTGIVLENLDEYSSVLLKRIRF